MVANDDADPTVRRDAFSRSGEHVHGDEDRTVAKHDRSGERVVPRHENQNVVQLAPRRAAGGRR